MSTTIDTATLDALGLSRQVTGKPRDKLGQDDFLKLMITQLQNQDPFKPLENGEFLGQIAQFGTVSGIEDLQKSFKSLASSLVSNQALQASELVGRQVLAQSSTGEWVPGGTLDGAVELSASVADMTVSIVDASGQVVRRIALGTQPAGLARFSWDGLRDDGSFAPAGRYRVKAEVNYGGTQYAVDTLIAAPVESVTLGASGGLSLNLSGIGTVGFADVRRIM